MAKQNPLVVSARTTQLALAEQKLSSGDPTGAELALVALANQIGGKEGDKALTLSLKRLPSTGLAQILVATATKPSAIVGGLVAPRDFANALVAVTKTWSAAGEDDAKAQLGELFLGVVMRPKDDGEYGAEASDFFKEMNKIGAEAFRLLAWWLKTQGYEPNFDPEGSFPGKLEYALETSEGGWIHLVALLRKHRFSGHVRAHMTVSYADLLPSVPAVAAIEADSTESAL